MVITRGGLERGPLSLHFFGGPMDGETIVTMRGLPRIAVCPFGCDDGFYVWHVRSARYEWRQVPPSPATP